MSRIVLADISTYLVGRDGRLFVMGEVSLWAGRVQGGKECPLPYSLCSDVPLRVELPFAVDSLAVSGWMVYLVTRDGGVFAHGQNQLGMVGVRRSHETSKGDTKFDVRALSYPEPIKRLTTSPDLVFAIGRSGVVYATPLEDLAREASGMIRPRALKSLVRITSIKHAGGWTLAMDADGSIWTIPALPRDALNRATFERLATPKALDFEMSGGTLYVLHEAGGFNDLACYRLSTDPSRGKPKSSRQPTCPYGTDKIAVPRSGALRLSALGNQAVAVVDDVSGRTYVPALEELRFPFPWLNGPSLEGALHSQAQRYAITGGEGIFLVGDGAFMENGSADGKTYFQPLRLKDYSWSPE